MKKVMLCYEAIKELTREGEMANNSYVVTNYMRMVRTFKELKKIKNIHDNIDNREYVINSLNTDLEQTNSVLDAINRFKNRVEIGINKEVLDTIDLCRASGVKIKDIRNFRENKNNDRHKETSIKKLKNRLVDLF